MEKINFNYSLKNIPIPPKDSYMKSFISKVESLIRRMRWKAFFSEKEENREDRIQTETYGFNTENTAPSKPLLMPFENDIYDWISTIKFSKHRSNFQKKLTTDRKNIQSSEEVYVPADKSTNIYKMKLNECNQLLLSKITSNYKKTSANTNKHKVKSGLAVSLLFLT